MNDKNQWDELVLLVQQWLNATYRNVEGYEPVKEDGISTWFTIYSLIGGLQHELGISQVVGNLGETTLAYYDSQVTPN